MKKQEQNKNSLPHLRPAWTGNSDFLILDLGNEQHLRVLHAAYEQIFAPNFQSGYASPTFWLNNYKTPGSNLETRIVIAGTGMRDDNEPLVLKGMLVGSYFKDSDTAFLDYVAVDPAYRTEGLGFALFQHYESMMLDSACRHGGELRGHYLDCEDPKKYTPEPGEYDPQKRVDKYLKWGGKQVLPGNYYLPSISRPGQLNEKLTLIAFPHPATQEYPDNTSTLNFLRSLFRHIGFTDPDEHRAFIHMQQKLEGKAPPTPQSPTAPGR